MSEASIRGRANQRAGYASEKRLEKMLKSWGLSCWRTPLSGAIKLEGLDGDLRVSIRNRIRKVENKRRVDLERFYKLIDGDKPVIIDGFAVLVSQDLFYDLVNGKKPNEVTSIPDKQFKVLKSFFNQDNADIVTMVSPYKPYIFALSLPLWEELYSYDDEVVA